MEESTKQAIQKEIDQLTNEIEALADGQEKLDLRRVRGRLIKRISDKHFILDKTFVWVEYPEWDSVECPF